MPATIISSREARQNWRDVLDKTMTGVEDIVIERHGKPVAALIPYEDYLAMEEALEEMRSARQAAAVYEAWQTDPTRGRPYAEVRAELVSEGRLDG